MAGGEPLPLALGPAVHGYESPIAESEDACGAAFERLIDDSGVSVVSPYVRRLPAEIHADEHPGLERLTIFFSPPQIWAVRVCVSICGSILLSLLMEYGRSNGATQHSRSSI
jgi:hypothetical protein